MSWPQWKPQPSVTLNFVLYKYQLTDSRVKGRYGPEGENGIWLEVYCSCRRFNFIKCKNKSASVVRAWTEQSFIHITVNRLCPQRLWVELNGLVGNECRPVQTCGFPSVDFTEEVFKPEWEKIQLLWKEWPWNVWTFIYCPCKIIGRIFKTCVWKSSSQPL